ncbi:MAG: antitoxin VapB family protein [Kiritimatiellia bacterium]
MKTITLDEEAYQRLKAWKSDTKDSFSKVVLRLVPPKGSLQSVAEFTETYKTDLLPNQDVLAATVEERSLHKENYKDMPGVKLHLCD